jgi:hypothetical protein
MKAAARLIDMHLNVTIGPQADKCVLRSYSAASKAGHLLQLLAWFGGGIYHDKSWGFGQRSLFWYTGGNHAARLAKEFLPLVTLKETQMRLLADWTGTEADKAALSEANRLRRELWNGHETLFDLDDLAMLYDANGCVSKKNKNSVSLIIYHRSKSLLYSINPLLEDNQLSGKVKEMSRNHYGTAPQRFAWQIYGYSSVKLLLARFCDHGLTRKRWHYSVLDTCGNDAVEIQKAFRLHKGREAELFRLNDSSEMVSGLMSGIIHKKSDKDLDCLRRAHHEAHVCSHLERLRVAVRNELRISRDTSSRTKAPVGYKQCSRECKAV